MAIHLWNMAIKGAQTELRPFPAQTLVPPPPQYTACHTRPEPFRKAKS
jgi:hypothetical protein